MKLNARTTLLASAALALVAFQTPALASGDRDAGLSFGSSFGVGYATERTSDTYGYGAGATHAGTHGFTTNDRSASQGFSGSRADAPDFHTTRDWR